MENILNEKNIVYMNDDEYDAFLRKYMEEGLTPEQIDAIIDSDIELICPVIEK